MHTQPRWTDGAGPPAGSLAPARAQVAEEPSVCRSSAATSGGRAPHRTAGPSGYAPSALCRADQDGVSGVSGSRGRQPDPAGSHLHRVVCAWWGRCRLVAHTSSTYADPQQPAFSRRTCRSPHSPVCSSRPLFPHRPTAITPFSAGFLGAHERFGVECQLEIHESVPGPFPAYETDDKVIALHVDADLLVVGFVVGEPAALKALP